MTKRADLRETRPLCLKSLKSDVPSAAMRKRAEVGLETVLYKLVHFADNRCKVMRPVWN